MSIMLQGRRNDICKRDSLWCMKNKHMKRACNHIFIWLKSKVLFHFFSQPLDRNQSQSKRYFCICHFVWIEHHWRLPQHGWHRLSGWVLRINVSLTLIVAVWVWILPLIASSRNLSRCARIQSFHCQRLLHKNKNCLLSFLATILSCIFCVSLLLNPNY